MVRRIRQLSDLHKASIVLALGLSCMAYSRIVKANGEAVAGVAMVQPSLNGVRAFPNPWRSDKNANVSITIDHLLANSTVKIFTVSGHWIKTLISSNDTVSWDLTNHDGDRVASGIYLYVVSAPGAEKVTGKLTVIR